MKQVILFSIGISLSLFSQSQPLTIGSRVPDINLHGLMDQEKDSISFRGSEGQLTILDFWNIHCKACIQLMPRMDSLKEEFGDRLRVIMVTGDNEKKVRDLFKKIKRERPKLPMIIGDTLVTRLFQPNINPWQIWIDDQGYIRQISTGYNSTSFNIKEALEGRYVKMRRKLIMEGFHEDSLLLINASGGLRHMMASYSLLVSGLHEYTGNLGIDIRNDPDSDRPYLLRAMNATILKLYDIAYRDDVYGFKIKSNSAVLGNRVHFDVPDPTIFYPDLSGKYEEWTDQNQFSYEIKVLPGQDLFKAMQKDLDRLFPYVATVEKRKMKCLVLSKTHEAHTGVDSLLIKAPDGINFVKDKSVYKNIDFFPRFYNELLWPNNKISTPLVADLPSGIKINMVLEAGSLGRIDILRKQLCKYGYSLDLKEKEIKMLRIRKKQE